MKILRVRRGYTTNSSGANEWVPPTNGPAAQATNAPAAQATDAPSPALAPGLSTSPAEASQVTILATQVAPPSASTAQPAGPSQRATRTTTNAGFLGAFVACLCVLLVATRWVLRRWSSRR